MTTTTTVITWSPRLLTATLAAAAAAAAVVAGGAAATRLSGTVDGKIGPGDWIDERELLVAVVMLVVVVVGVGEVVMVADRSVLLTGIVTAVINWRFLLGTTSLIAAGAVDTPGPEAAVVGSAAIGACGATISTTVGATTMASVIGMAVVLDEGDDEAELDDDGGEGG